MEESLPKLIFPNTVDSLCVPVRLPTFPDRINSNLYMIIITSDTILKE